MKITQKKSILLKIFNENENLEQGLMRNLLGHFGLIFMVFGPILLGLMLIDQMAYFREYTITFFGIFCIFVVLLYITFYLFFFEKRMKSVI